MKFLLPILSFSKDEEMTSNFMKNQLLCSKYTKKPLFTMENGCKIIDEDNDIEEGSLNVVNHLNQHTIYLIQRTDVFSKKK